MSRVLAGLKNVIVDGSNTRCLPLHSRKHGVLRCLVSMRRELSKASVGFLFAAKNISVIVVPGIKTKRSESHFALNAKPSASIVLRSCLE